MFWRFGFHNASSIDSLLDRDDVALEDVLDEDELLQECKAQNTRLIDYFQRLDVLQRMLGYVAGSIEGEEKGRFKYPYVATEVLCSEIWSIVEACVTNSEQLLVPFWETVLDRSPDDMRTRSAMAAHFAKINGVFMNKKPSEMLAFIRSQPFVVERLILHIETPPIVDLLFRIIQLDEYPTGAGVLEWLSSEKLIPQLVDLLSPSKSAEIHTIAADILKGIITMSAPSPGASALNDSSQHVPACNRFARELASRENMSKLLRFMLDDVPITAKVESNGNGGDLVQAPEWTETVSDSDDDDAYERPGVPTAASATSSLVNSISVVIELIRKNNSDYFEPYLFHNLRNRLIQVQQHMNVHSEEGREVLERTMKEMVDRVGVVHLGTMLGCFCERLDSFQELLRNPRSLNGPISTTVGQITPLTTERFRICELYAELLHCSNMALLNRASGTGPLYDDEGRLQGGLSAMEELARVISTGGDENETSEANNDDSQSIAEARELPVHSISSISTRSTDSSSLASDSDSELSDHSSEDLDEIAVSEHPEPPFPIRTRSREFLVTPSESAAAQSSQENAMALNTMEASQISSSLDLSVDSEDICADDYPRTLPIGDVLKQRYMEAGVVSSLLDLFFQFPWNNFLHGTVYDLVHQIVTGRTDGGLNRAMIVSLFRDAKLFHRIVEGHEENDSRSRQPKGVRLGFMGHLTLISEDVINALEHYPEELSAEVRAFAPQPAWDHYVNGGYKETKKRDTSLLGGGKPVITTGTSLQKGRWPKVDEEDALGSVNGLAAGQNGKAEAVGAVATTSALHGEFKRTLSTNAPRNTADFGLSQEEEEATPSQFATYLASEINAPAATQFSSTSFSDDDDEDDGAGWLATSTPFELGSPPGARQPDTNHSSSPFNDPFIPSSTSNAGVSSAAGFSDSFNDDDDGFGPFSDAPISSDGFALDQEESQFDFGDFQTAEEPSDGEMTPTAGSWTFESVSDSTISLSDSTFSFDGSNEDLNDLQEQLESANLNDTTNSSQSKHIRTASIG